MYWLVVHPFNICLSFKPTQSGAGHGAETDFYLHVCLFITNLICHYLKYLKLLSTCKYYSHKMMHRLMKVTICIMFMIWSPNRSHVTQLRVTACDSLRNPRTCRSLIRGWLDRKLCVSRVKSFHNTQSSYSFRQQIIPSIIPPTIFN